MSKSIYCLLLFFFIGSHSLYSQISLDDLKPFEVGKNWQIVGDVTAIPGGEATFTTEKGKGVLVNIPSDKHHSNLLSKDLYGDVDVEMEFMMAPHSNSGIYLMGRYEVQLLDSWGVLKPKYGDLGGIYQRRRKDGSQFEGHAPRVNAAKAPGTWQKISISFQAPRFNGEGEKISNAKILKVVLNGYTIQENLELSGPTGGPISEEEAAIGPIMIQGDHGPVAFRNISIKEFSNPTFLLSGLKRTILRGEIQPLLRFDWEGMKTEASDVNQIDVFDINEDLGWASIFKGKLEIPQSGLFTFSLQAGGESQMMIDGKSVVPKAWSRTNWAPRTGIAIQLEKGTHDMEVIYSKVDGWLPTGLGVFVESNNIRRKALHKATAIIGLSNAQGAVFISADIPRVVRSFVSLPTDGGEHVFTHVVNVGSPSGLHFTYDTSTGRLLRLWKGDFLDASPMWNGRGNAQSIAKGPQLILTTEKSAKPGFTSKGYDIKSDGYPVFRSTLDGKPATDEIISDGKTLVRTLKSEGLSNKRVVIMEASSIEKIAEGLYSINDKDFFISSESPLTLTVDQGRNILSAVVSGSTLSYKIIW